MRRVLLVVLWFAFGSTFAAAAVEGGFAVYCFCASENRRYGYGDREEAPYLREVAAQHFFESRMYFAAAILPAGFLAVALRKEKA
jgi:hypothetical protein